MGKLARYRRNKKVGDAVPKNMDFDRAPTKKDDQKMSRSMRRFMEAKRIGEKLTTKKGKKRPQVHNVVSVSASAGSVPKTGLGQQDKRKAADKPKEVQQRMNESITDFKARVEREYKASLQTSGRKNTKKNEKRAAYFDKQKEKAKEKAAGKALTSEKRLDAEISEMENKVFKADKVAFGETCMAPPTLSVAPRRRALRDGAGPLLLDKANTRRRDMDAATKRQHDEARTAAINQYRENQKK
eukprot:CFRG0797T1